MAQLVLIALAAALGFVAYSEAAKVEHERGRGPAGMSAYVCAGAAGLTALVAGFLVAPVVVAAGAGYVGYISASTFERQNRFQLFGVPTFLYSFACFFFGLFGALFTSAPTWTILCTLVALSVWVLLLLDEVKVLRAANEKLQTDASRPPASRPEPAAPARPQPPPEAEVSTGPDVARKAYLFGPRAQAPRPAQPAAWTSPPRPAAASRPDLVPQRWGARPASDDANDLLPRRK